MRSPRALVGALRALRFLVAAAVMGLACGALASTTRSAHLPACMVGGIVLAVLFFPVAAWSSWSEPDMGPLCIQGAGTCVAALLGAVVAPWGVFTLTPFAFAAITCLVLAASIRASAKVRAGFDPRSSCRACGYARHGAKARRCPECGNPW